MTVSALVARRFSRFLAVFGSTLGAWEVVLERSDGHQKLIQVVYTSKLPPDHKKRGPRACSKLNQLTAKGRFSKNTILVFERSTFFQSFFLRFFLHNFAGLVKRY